MIGSEKEKETKKALEREVEQAREREREVDRVRKRERETKKALEREVKQAIEREVEQARGARAREIEKKVEEFDRDLLTEFSVDILKKHNYYPPSFYLKKSDDTTKDIINDVNANLLYLGESIKNNAVFEKDPSGYTIARPKKKNPSKKNT